MPDLFDVTDVIEMIDLAAIINVNINPVLVDTGGFELTWHGLFTAVGIALACGWRCGWRGARASPRTTRCPSPSSRCSRASSARGCSG